jgi:hypothetical protein
MALVMTCRKCGGDIEMSTEAVQEALNTGRSILIEHDVCPTPGEVKLRTFKIRIEVSEITRTVLDEDNPEDDMEETHETLATLGQEVAGESFTACLEDLQKALGKQWTKVVEMAAVIDG